MLWTIRLHKNHVSADKAGIYAHFLQARNKTLSTFKGIFWIVFFLKHTIKNILLFVIYFTNLSSILSK